MMNSVYPPAQSTTIESVISDIDRLIEDNITLVGEKIGLDYGLLGVACYRQLISLERNADVASSQEQTVIETIFTKLNEGYLFHDMYREIADLAWYLSVHAERYGVNDPTEKEELLSGLDDIVLGQVTSYLKKGDIDPITGAVKFGFYLLERIDLKPEYKQYIHHIVEALDDLAVPGLRPGELRWPATFNDSGDYYTGLSHGVAGVLLFCTYATKKTNHPKLKTIIDGCIRTLENSINTESPTIFPVMIGKTYQQGDFPKSYAYGDYSTLFAFLYSLKLLGLTDKVEQHINLLEVIHRKGYGNDYFDAGPSILYGDAGLIMLARRFQEEFAIPAADDAYEYLTQKLLKRYDASKELLGFKGYWSQHLPWTNLSFTEGLLGIRCVLSAVRRPDLYSLFDRYFFLRKPI